MWLGDMVAAVTSAFGVKPCAPCKARQAQWNAWHQKVAGVPQQPQLQPGEFLIEVSGEVEKR
jgi:hypothetical protein